MPPISTPGASRIAELNVTRNTSAEQLRVFHAERTDEASGEIRAEKNKDGSVTLYMPRLKEKSLGKTLFGEDFRSGDRKTSRDLATSTVKDILRRHLEASIPSSKSGLFSGNTPKDEIGKLLTRLDKKVGHTTNDSLEKTFNGIVELRDSMAAEFNKLEAISPNVTKNIASLNVILSEPVLANKFDEHLVGQAEFRKQFKFLQGLHAYEKLGEPAEKMRFAEELVKVVGSADDPDIGGKISLPGEVATKISRDIDSLRKEMAAGGLTSLEGKDRLNNLFNGANAVISENLENPLAVGLNAFSLSLKFKAAVGELLISRPEYKEVGKSTNLEEVMAEPDMKAAFRAHLGSALEPGETAPNRDARVAAFDRFDQAKGLVEALGGSSPNKDSLIALAQRLINDIPANLPMKNVFEERLEGLRSMAEGGAGGSIDFGDQLGGIVNSQLKGLLKQMVNDAAAEVRGNVWKSFTGSSQMLAVLAKRQPQTAENFGSFAQFADVPTAHAGGKSGSQRLDVGANSLQAKFDIKNGKLIDRLKASGLNIANDSEMISGHILRGMRSEASKALVPELALLQDSATHKTVMVSKYLQNGQGNLDQHYESKYGALTSSHVKVAVNLPGESGGGVLRLTPQQNQDVLHNLAERALIGDHDVNAGNVIMVGEKGVLGGQRVGQIDFGHAFNDLIAGPGRAIVGGGQKVAGNRILDFFNRETVAGSLTNKSRESKLWRDYTGVGPSEGMTEALRSLGNNTKSQEGLAQAESAYVRLFAVLNKEDTPAAKAQITSQLASLAYISANVGQTIDVANPDPEKVVLAAFKALATFITDGQKQMLDVADLSALQTRIEEFVATPRDPKLPIPADIKAGFAEIMSKDNQTCKAAGSTGLNWMKLEKGAPGFVGNLEGYVASRRAQLFPAQRGGGMNELQQKAILADFKKRALEVHPTQAVKLLMAEPKDGVVRSKILELAVALFSPENFRYIQDLQDLKAAQPLSTDSAARAKLINDYIHGGAKTPVNIGNAGRINEAAGYLMNLTEPSHNAVKALQFLRTQNVKYEPLPAADFYKPVDELDKASRDAAPNTTAIDQLEANSIGASPEPFQEMRDQLSRASQIVIFQLQNSFIERYLGEGSSMAERISPQLKREILDLQEQDRDNGAPQPEVIKALGQKLASIPNDLMARAAASPDYPRHVSAALNQAIATMLEFTEDEVGNEFGKNAMLPPTANNKTSLLTF